MHTFYFRVLELSPGASSQEIKAAYRRLSKRYHPDINKQANAMEHFIQIHEAYRYLTEVYPELLKVEAAKAATQARPANNNDPRQVWKEKMRQQAREKAYEEVREQQRLIQKVLHGFHYLLVLIMISNGLLFLDYLLPYQEFEQQIRGVSGLYHVTNVEYVYKRGGSQYDGIRFDDYDMRFKKGEIQQLDIERPAKVYISSILQKPQFAMLWVNGIQQKYQQVLTIYGVSKYLFSVVLVMFVLYLFVFKLPDTRLSVAIFVSFLFFIQIVFCIGFW